MVKAQQRYLNEWDNLQNAAIQRLGHTDSGIKSLGHTDGSNSEKI